MKFEISGTKFDLAPLKPIEALKALGILTEKAFPAIYEAVGFIQGKNASNDDVFLSKLALIAAALPELFKIFEDRCQVEWQGRTVPLNTFSEYVFERKPTLILAWLTYCLRAEFGDFLGADGQKRLQEAGSQLTSLLGSLGPSGE